MWGASLSLWIQPKSGTIEAVPRHNEIKKRLLPKKIMKNLSCEEFPNWYSRRIPSCTVALSPGAQWWTQPCRAGNLLILLLLYVYFYIYRRSQSMPREHKVIVYSTPTCSWCTKLKSWLREKRIRFVEVDVSKDARAAEELVRKTGQMGVPVTLVDGRPVIGFNQPMLERLLAS